MKRSSNPERSADKMHLGLLSRLERKGAITVMRERERRKKSVAKAKGKP